MAPAVGSTALAAPLVDPERADAAEAKLAPLEATAAHRRGLLLMTAGLFAYIPDGTLIKLVRAPTETTALWRMSIAGCALLSLQLVRRGRALPAAVRGMGPWGGLVTVLAGLNSWLFVEAVKATTVANTVMIMATSSFWAALLGRLALGTPVRLCTWAAMPVVCAGVAVSVSSDLRATMNSGDYLS
ncbi:unnamed protein product [Prorocentrum cordatum]|uniref:EamA domain-containing protein n=1 Tax=Prorocentrum cordatum TaxID=2364126 RepID=A0ABN9SX50_9DINO|nr:unnamed protein product [Polarella glacialis]